jgi:hypothetical protein
MACKDEIHEEDEGTEFITIIQKCVDGVLSPMDVSNATSKIIKFKRAGAATEVRNAVFTSIASGGTGDGTDGKISYFSVLGDLPVTGKTSPSTYKIQGKVINPAGTWSSTIEKFKVYPNL